jgi:hypothetical protein
MITFYRHLLHEYGSSLHVTLYQRMNINLHHLGMLLPPLPPRKRRAPISNQIQRQRASTVAHPLRSPPLFLTRPAHGTSHARRPLSVAHRVGQLRCSGRPLLIRRRASCVSRATVNQVHVCHGERYHRISRCFCSSALALRSPMAASCPSRRSSTCSSTRGRSALARCCFAHAGA